MIKELDFDRRTTLALPLWIVKWGFAEMHVAKYVSVATCERFTSQQAITEHVQSKLHPIIFTT